MSERGAGVLGTTFGVGAPALFNLAMNIAAVPIGVVAIPFAIAAFPVLSDAAAKNDREAFRSAFSTTLKQILFFLVPLTTMAFVLRLHVVRVRAREAVDELREVGMMRVAMLTGDRQAVARRAACELFEGAVVNYGVGIPEAVQAVDITA